MWQTGIDDQCTKANKAFRRPQISWFTRWVELSFNFVINCHIYRLEKHQLQLDSCHHRGFVDGFCDTLLYPRIWRIVGLHDEPVQIPIDAPCLRRFLTPLTRYQQPRLSFDLQVLVLPIPLLSLTAVTIYASSAKILISVQIAFRTSYVWQIFFRRTFEVTCMDLAIIRKVW